jgi:hypothetical protein
MEGGKEAATETGPGPEPSAETGPPETGTDASEGGHHEGGHDGGDSGTDAKDTGTDAKDVGTDAPPPALDFPRQVAQAYCEQMASCCFPAMPSQFDVVGCVNDAIDLKDIPLTNLGIGMFALNSPNFTFDSSAAAKCIAGFATLSCTSNSNTVLQALEDQCSAAFIPKLTPGATGCESAFDCPLTTYCAPLTLNSDFIAVPPAGGGTCTLLQTTGGTCVDTGYGTDCNYQGGQQGADYCKLATNQCTTALANGGDCSDELSNQECSSGQCVTTVSGTATCGTTVPFTVFYEVDQCANYNKADGG